MGRTVKKSASRKLKDHFTLMSSREYANKVLLARHKKELGEIHQGPSNGTSNLDEKTRFKLELRTRR